MAAIYRMKSRRVTELDSTSAVQNTEKFDQGRKISEIDPAQLDTFHRAIRPIMLLAQCFAIMPLIGVHRLNPHDVKFHWKSFGMFVTSSFLLVGGMSTMAFLKSLVVVGIDPKNMVGLVFFLCGLTACVLFLYLAKQWPDLIQLWYETEIIFLKAPYATAKWRLLTRVRMAACIILMLSITEHALFLSSSYYNYTMHILLCNISITPNFDNYMTENFKHVFEYVPYNTMFGIITLIINASFTFMWNYMDLFIIMVSLGIAIRFQQISARVNAFSSLVVSEDTWLEVRLHYVKMCELLEIIDENLSSLILLSCANNLYFICYQLLNIFNKLRWPINYYYFWYSLLYLIGRTTALFLCAASANDASKAPLKVLRNVSTEEYCVEIERFIAQMTTQCVALSGKKFFHLTRKLLFGMAGTVVTYELVLLQFDEPNRKKGLGELCP